MGTCRRYPLLYIHLPHAHVWTPCATFSAHMHAHKRTGTLLGYSLPAHTCTHTSSTMCVLASGACSQPVIGHVYQRTRAHTHTHTHTHERSGDDAIRARTVFDLDPMRIFEANVPNACWNSDTHQRSVERYNPTTNRWTSMPGLTTRRENLGVAVFDGQVFAAGGFDR